MPSDKLDPAPDEEGYDTMFSVKLTMVSRWRQKIFTTFTPARSGTSYY